MDKREPYKPQYTTCPVCRCNKAVRFGDAIRCRKCDSNAIGKKIVLRRGIDLTNDPVRRQLKHENRNVKKKENNVDKQQMELF